MADDDDVIRVVIEIPKGSRNKYEVDPDTGEIELDRRLFASVSYPTEYGYVPGTLASDGDALDALVCATEPTFPGCHARVRPIGMILMRMAEGEGAPNPKLVCVPLRDPAWNDIEDVEQLPDELRDEIKHFFDVYMDLESGGAEVQGWLGRDDAREELRRARDRCREGSDGG
ncbi:MAG TPA: inorganic diphosphatase [Solirubrobacteraceae bacterium]|nr:inorganic diphosphatase [Solirubrobacteraceae bacterium]